MSLLQKYLNQSGSQPNIQISHRTAEEQSLSQSVPG